MKSTVCKKCGLIRSFTATIGQEMGAEYALKLFILIREMQYQQNGISLNLVSLLGPSYKYISCARVNMGKCITMQCLMQHALTSHSYTRIVSGGEIEPSDRQTNDTPEHTELKTSP